MSIKEQDEHEELDNTSPNVIAAVARNLKSMAKSDDAIIVATGLSGESSDRL